jgi:hypothetical protein
VIGTQRERRRAGVKLQVYREFFLKINYAKSVANPAVELWGYLVSILAVAEHRP